MLKPNIMKNHFNKAALLVVSLLFLSKEASAGIKDKFMEFVGNEFHSYEGLYIMAGVIVSGLLIYIFTNHFVKEEKREIRHNMNPARERRYHQRVIKKTP